VVKLAIGQHPLNESEIFQKAQAHLQIRTNSSLWREEFFLSGPYFLRFDVIITYNVLAHPVHKQHIAD